MEKINNNEQICKLYKEMFESISELHAQEVDDYYEEGFKLGVLLGLEIR